MSGRNVAVNPAQFFIPPDEAERAQFSTLIRIKNSLLHYDWSIFQKISFFATIVQGQDLTARKFTIEIVSARSDVQREECERLRMYLECFHSIL